MEERTLATLIQSQDMENDQDEATTLLDTSAEYVEEPEVAKEAVKRSERRARKLQAKRKTRAAKVAKRTTRAAPASGLELTGKAAKAEWAAMYRHWKRIHEISGAILVNLEEFSQQTKQR